MTSITERCALANTLAARQHGLVSRHQLLEAGISRKQIELWQQTGFFVHVEHGVFLVAGARLDWSARLQSACLLTNGLASHRSAAALHGVSGGSRGRPEITIPEGQSFRRDGVRVHESRDLHLIAPVLKDGIPTTPVARTVLDLGAVNRFAVEGAARDAVAQRLTTWPELFRTLVGHSRKGRRGCGPLRAVLDEHYGDQAESALERRFLAMVKLSGVPAPKEQIEVHDSDGFIMRLDFAYPDLLIAIEIDSVLHHATDRAFEQDRIKRNRLVLAGWMLLAFTSDRMRRRPATVCEQLARAVSEREAFFRQPDPLRGAE